MTFKPIDLNFIKVIPLYLSNSLAYDQNIRMRNFLITFLLVIVNLLAVAQTTVTFNFTGGNQNFTVPACVTSINVTVNGAQGGGAGGGLGASITGALTVVPGQVLQISVGGQGTCPGTAFGGGGAGQNSNCGWPSCGGGGASFIGTGGGMTNALVVAGGGGGNGGGDTGGAGGSGGCATGNAGTTTYGYGGGGGTQTGGGTGGSPWTAGGGTGGNGSFGQGGAGAVDAGYGCNPGGGGGGGYYGGGGAGSDNISLTSFAGGGGGGGGSSLVPAGFACTGGGNAGPGQIVITYNATSPTLTVNSPTICPGKTATLTAGGGTTYTWQPGNIVGNNVSVSPASTTVYTVTSGSGACVATKTTQVVVSPGPTPIAGSNSPVCVNQPINFTGSGGTTYTWTGPGGFTSNAQNPSIASAVAGNAGTYTLTVTAASGCTASITTPVVVNPLPVIAVTNPTVCTGNTINLSANGGSTYSWNGPNGFTSNVQNPAITNASTVMTGAYNVTVTSAAGCTNTAVSNVSVITLPVPTISSNTPCVGQTLNLTGGGGGTYSWTGPNGFSSATQNPSIANVTAAAAGTYSLVVTVGTCSNIVTKAVTINALPTPTAGSNSPVCVGTSINFSGSSASSYTWSGPGLNSNSQNPSIAVAQSTNSGTYTLSVTNANGCVNFTTTAVTVNPLPVIAVTNPTVCVGQNINLSANGGATYSWSGPNAYSSNLQAPTIVSSNTTMSGGYTVVVTSAAGCTASAVSNVSVYPVPTPAIANNTPCANSTLSLTGTGGASYSWTGPNGFSSAAQNPTIPNVSLAASGIYTLIASAGNCTASATKSVTINPLPVPTATSNSAVCVNQTINFTGTGGTTYTWTGPASYNSTSQNPVLSVAQSSNAGTYTLTVTDANGCKNFTTTNVVVNPLPVIAVTNPTVCVNQTINLSANGGAGYAWSGPQAFTANTASPSITNASTLMTGAYTVTVTTAAGCTASAVSNVSVITLPQPSIASNTPCVGSTLTFTGLGGSIYSWSGPNGFSGGTQNPTIPNVSMAANGTYTLVVTAGTCSNVTTKAVVINPLPVPTATSNSAVCANQALNFSGTGGTTYTWTGPSSYNSTQQSPVIASAQATNAGTYTLTVTDANGCVNFTTTNVVVNPLPVIVVNNPTACVNQNISLTSNGGAQYTWSGPLSYTSSAQNPTITNATTAMSGAYTVLVTTASGCTATAVSNVSVIPLPVPSVSSNTPCVGASLNLTGAGGTSYSWTGPNGFASAAQNPVIPNVTMAAAGVYSLTVTTGMCSNNTTGTITINPLPTPSITGNGPVCLNQPATFTATGGNSYSWSGPNNFVASGPTAGINSSQLSNAGTYVVTATDLNNCTNTASYQLVVNPLPVIIAVGSTVCANQNITLSATGGNIFVWSGPNGFTSNSQFPVIPNAALSMVGIYTVTVTDGNGCTSTSLTSVGVNPIPTPTISSNSPICVNQTITLASGAPTGVTYIWNGPNGYFANGPVQQIKPAGLANSGTYTVVVTDNIGCSASISVNMLVNPLPDGTIASTNTAGCVPLCTTFTCQSSTGPLTFCSWDFGYGANASGTTVANCYQKDGMFTVTAYFTDINGCSNTNTFVVTPYPIPTADFNFAPQRPVEGEQVDFTNSSYGLGLSGYSWYFSNLTNTVITEHNPSMIFQTPGGYAVVLVASNKYGCSDTIIRPVLVYEDYGLYVPNAFTPNGDGVNDVFFPKGFGIVSYELFIFDRWGEKLFHTNKFEEGWAGNYSGRNDEPVPNDTYVWLIKLTNVRGKSLELNGKVTVSR